jgi:ABC-type spermidine/putrescine transport system permease subunit II
MTIQNKRLGGIVLAATLLLLVPLVAMQFSTSVKWTGFDFIVAGVLLYSTGLLCEFVLRKIHKPGIRIAVCAGIILALILLWAELAVGIFGTPLAGS